MDMLGNDTEHLFTLPVALILQNELGTTDQNEYGYNTTTPTDAGPNQTGQNWKGKEIALGEPQRLEKIGDVIRKELKWAFILHTYGFGCLFFILAFYTFFSILNIRSFISTRPFMSTINGFLCLLGASRATSLFIDPYNLKENMPRLFGQVLWDVGFPSIISAFSLVQLAFLEFTQFRVGPEGLRRKSCLSLIVTAHFLLTIAMDIVVASHENLMTLKHAVHYVFLSWGIFLCSNFLYSGYKIMSMLKSFPEREFRDFHDASYKGIVQLAMLAPHNNLAGSVTAALLPTLCSPKIHQQENSNLSFVGFKSDGNSRILESESIPMLEELMGSSADEACSKPLVRASSFQSQNQNSQKLNPKAKLYLKSNAQDSRDEELAQGKRTGAASLKASAPKDHFSKGVPLKANDSELSVKSAKRKENFITSSRQVKRKLDRRTCFESQNFCFANEKKGRQTAGIDNLVPEILVSCPGNSETLRPKVTDTRGERGEHTSKDLPSELSTDLAEMRIVREHKTNRSEEVAEVHNSTGKTCHGQRKNSIKDKNEVVRCDAEKGNEISERSNPSDLSMAEMPSIGNEEAQTEGSSLKEFTKFQQTQPIPRKVRSRRKGKSLSWKKKPDDEEEVATRECLLLQEQSTDAALRSVLNHMADMNRGTANNANCDNANLEKMRKSKVEWVLNITYITAMWGLMLCLSYMGKIYSSFGLIEPRKTVSRLNPAMHSRDGVPRESPESGVLFSCWPWLWFQTFCRALELAMGCAMAWGHFLQHIENVTEINKVYVHVRRYLSRPMSIPKHSECASDGCYNKIPPIAMTFTGWAFGGGVGRFICLPCKDDIDSCHLAAPRDSTSFLELFFTMGD